MTARPGNDPPAPYVGLRPFEFDEASLFYGRGEHIAEIVRTLRKGYFLAVVGSSGSGKSSLVRAGLLPAIAAGFMDGSEEAADWRFVIMRPGLDPRRIWCVNCCRKWRRASHSILQPSSSAARRSAAARAV